MFTPDHLTLGVFFPIEAFTLDQPTMHNQVNLAKQAELGGMAALWFRDVPLRDPKFGDIGQIFDPWVYLGYIAAQTSTIALATGAIVLPIRHPLHTAKAAASVDQLSKGRLVLGIASGDRPVEFPAFGVEMQFRGDLFREHLRVFRQSLSVTYPTISSYYGAMAGADLVPKPFASSIPTMIVGQSQQELSWIAQNGDGWFMYPRPVTLQKNVVDEWRKIVDAEKPGAFLPFGQSLYIDLNEDPYYPATPIHLGYRIGRNGLTELLGHLQMIGVNHVILNLKYGRRPADEVLDELIEYVVPHFPAVHTNSRSENHVHLAVGG
ncbi:LLM class oxidoreductase [bacterium]|nr:LLM class oxidoreductase [bacterium]